MMVFAKAALRVEWKGSLKVEKLDFEMVAKKVA